MTTIVLPSNLAIVVSALSTMARSAPTGNTSSSSPWTSARTPEAGASTVASTLSVSRSTSGSPASTVSPTALCQRTTVASVIDDPHFGTRTSAIPTASLGAEARCAERLNE